MKKYGEYNVTRDNQICSEKILRYFGIAIDSFSDVRLKSARGARDEKILQMKPEERRWDLTAFTYKELLQILKLHDENKPDGPQKNTVNCVTDFFHEGKFNNWASTNRIEYNPIFTKTCPDGAADWQTLSG